jgi:hypothetical protein
MWQKIWQFLCDQDWLILFVPMVIMTVLFYCAKLWFWGGMFTAIMAIFGLTELVSKLATGRTISQQFAKFLKEHKVFAWVIIWAMGTFWFALLVHLLSTTD